MKRFVKYIFLQTPGYEKICQVHFPTKMTYAQNRNSRAISGQILEYRSGVAIFSTYGYQMYGFHGQADLKCRCTQNVRYTLSTRRELVKNNTEIFYADFFVM